MGKRTGKPRGRPPKPKFKPPDATKRYGLRQAIDDAVSPEEKQRVVKTLFKRSPGEAARVMASVETKEKAPEEGKTFFLLISGLSDGVSCLRCGWQRGVHYREDLPWLQALSDEQKAAYQEESNKLALAHINKAKPSEKESAPSDWRKDARKQQVAVPGEGPSPRAERSSDIDDDDLDPPRQRLLDPEGRPINLGAIPDKPRFPFGSGEIP